jgi:SAM-dependent methyltransferase
MLLVDREQRPPAAAGDAVALPFRNDAFDVVLAPFSLNHLPDPARGMREAARVADRLLASAYATDDDHPAKLAVETALTEFGWRRPAWYGEVKAAMDALGTIETAREAVVRGGLCPTRIEREAVVFDELGPVDMVAWRSGMAPSAAFVAALSVSKREELVERAVELLGPNPPPIERRVILIAAGR